MKCRYDLNKKCTEECKHINTCAWTKDKTRRAKVQQDGRIDDDLVEKKEDV